MKNKNNLYNSSEEEFIAFVADYLQDLEYKYSSGFPSDCSSTKFELVSEISETFHNKYNEIVLGLPAEEA